MEFDCEPSTNDDPQLFNQDEFNDLVKDPKKKAHYFVRDRKNKTLGTTMAFFSFFF